MLEELEPPPQLEARPEPAFPLPDGKDFHFFICHHQGSGGDQSNILNLRLTKLGYSVWYDNAQNALHRNLEGMQKGVRKSVCFLIFLSGRKETDGLPDLNGEYEGPFTRWYCHEEMSVAHEAGLRCIGVMESEQPKGKPDLALERSRAMNGNGGGPVNPKAQHNMHLLDEIVFSPFRRQEDELVALLMKIVEQAQVDKRLAPYPAIDYVLACDAISEAQLETLQSRLEALHEARLLTDEELNSLEDAVVDCIEVLPTAFATDSKVEKVVKMILVSESVTSDKALARQLKRKFA